MRIKITNTDGLINIFQIVFAPLRFTGSSILTIIYLTSLEITHIKNNSDD